MGKACVVIALLACGCGRIRFDLLSGTQDGGGDGDDASRDSPPGSMTLTPSAALSGDGFVATPDLCGTTVFDAYPQATYQAIHVGRDWPCSANATYRAFVRFVLDPLAGITPTSAIFRVRLESKIGPTAGVRWLRIVDFSMVGTSSWNAAVLTDLGVQITPSTLAGSIDTNVLGELTTALATGDAAIAFELRYEDEATDPGMQSRWYGFVANDNGSNGPELVVTY